MLVPFSLFLWQGFETCDGTTPANFDDHGYHNHDQVLLYSSCAAALAAEKIPTLAAYNGLQYPPKPRNLPDLNAISARLISPRLPFMQIRRLRQQTGSYTIIGQIINVPIDVQSTINSVDDDFAINICMEKHVIHKTSAYSGQVKKSVLRSWLNFPKSSPLYRLLNISVDWNLLDNFGDDEHQEELKTVSEDDASELFLAQQQSLLWSEDKYLCIIPGQNSTPLSLIYDEFAEELSFPDIYCGHSKKFRPGIRVTPYRTRRRRVISVVGQIGGVPHLNILCI